jgi:hypothetical protein
MHVSRDDRRVVVLRVPDESRGELGAEWFRTVYYPWLQQGGAQVLAGWLAGRDLSAFEHRGVAPMTEAKAMLQTLSLGSLAGAVEELIESRQGPWARDLFSAGELVGLLAPVLRGSKVSVTPHSIGRALRLLGGALLRARSADTGGTVRLWAVRNVPQYREMVGRADGTLGKVYAEQCARWPVSYARGTPFGPLGDPEGGGADDWN